MLKPALVALTVMGCDCDARLCVPLAGSDARFATLGECEAAVVPAIRQGSATYPLVTARCVVDSPAAFPMLATFDNGTAPAAAPARPLASGAIHLGGSGQTLVYRVGDVYVAARGELGRMLGEAASMAVGAAGWGAGKMSMR